MDIRITPTMAKEILDMRDDWDSKFVEDNREYQSGYISGTTDFLSILRISRKDLQALSKQRY